MPKVTGLLPAPLPAILTGSRVYGIPQPDSDIDLVVYMSQGTYNQLCLHADSVEDSKSATMDDGSTQSLKFGSLNLIAVTDPLTYDVWKKGTEFLLREAPVDRKRAITVLDEFKRKAVEDAKSNR